MCSLLQSDCIIDDLRPDSKFEWSHGYLNGFPDHKADISIIIAQIPVIVMNHSMYPHRFRALGHAGRVTKSRYLQYPNDAICAATETTQAVMKSSFFMEQFP